jgi:hypothetical protein
MKNDMRAMLIRNIPTGYVAKCQCGKYVGAIDAERTPISEISQMVSRWFSEGLAVEPRFGKWDQFLESCKCGK